jgi:hypothetical protein
MRRDSLRGGGARILLLPPQQHGCLPQQVPHVHGHEGRVLPLPPVASEEEVQQTRTCNKLGRGTSGARHVPPSNNNRSNQRLTGTPRKANGTGNATQRQQQQRQQQPRGQQQQQQDSLNHKREIEKLNLELEVAKIKVANMSYANIVKGTPHPPQPQQQPQLQPQQQPQPRPQPRSTSDLERQQAFKNLFVLYDSQYQQMMRIREIFWQE